MVRPEPSWAKAKARIRILDPMLDPASRTSWKKLVDAGFWKYFAVYVAGKVFGGEWNAKLKYKAQREIAELLVDGAAGLAETLRHFQSLLGNATAELAKWEIEKASHTASIARLNLEKSDVEATQAKYANKLHFVDDAHDTGALSTAFTNPLFEAA
jgi:hypothetical protein